MPFRVANNPTKLELVLTVVGAIGFHGVRALVLGRHRLTDLGDSDLREHRWVGG